MEEKYVVGTIVAILTILVVIFIVGFIRHLSTYTITQTIKKEWLITSVEKGGFYCKYFYIDIDKVTKQIKLEEIQKAKNWIKEAKRIEKL